MSSTSITPLKFTGVSTFSADFQQILTRAVNIASLPAQKLQNDQATVLAKKQALGTLGAAVSDLDTAVKNLAKVGDTSALDVASTNTSLVTVTNNGLTSPATYTISDITSVAKAASETTASGLATADSTVVDADGQLQLVVGDQKYSIDVSSSNNLNAVAAKINSLGAGVTATVLNTGSGANPYYLSLTATRTGATTLQLRSTADNEGTNLLTSANQGANAEFKLNGLPVSKPDNVIGGVVPNVTFTIVNTTSTGQTVDLIASSNRTTLGSAIQSFVSAYNALADARNSEVGQNAGILSGDIIVQQVSRALRSLTGYRDAEGTSVKSLTDLGISLDKSGKMSFDQAVFYSLPSQTMTDAYHFFRSATGGFGALASSLDTLNDSSTGMIKAQLDQFDEADKRLTAQISTITERVNNMQISLQAKLEQADSLLSTLQSQQSLLTAVYANLNPSTANKNNGQ